MVWTDAMREKAAATRAAKKNGATPVMNFNTAHRGAYKPSDPAPIYGFSLDDQFDWEDAPLAEAINKAADMKRELDRVQAIVLRRQNPPKKMWTCWTELMRKEIEIPRSVTSQCLKRGEDGKWKFRDDGRFVTVDGVRTLQPAFCCNFLCYAVYQKYRVTPPAREAQVQPRT